MYKRTELNDLGLWSGECASLKGTACREKAVKATSCRREPNLSGAQNRLLPATNREVERALAADIDTGMPSLGGQAVAGATVVEAIKGAERAIDALIGPRDKALTVKEVESLKSRKRANGPRARMLLAVERLGVVMALPCRLSEPLELLRSHWSELMPLARQVLEGAVLEGDQDGVEVICRKANVLMGTLREQAAQRRYLDRRRHRALQAERNLASLRQMLDAALQTGESLQVVVMEFAHSLPAVPGSTVDFGALVALMASNRSRLLDCCRNSETLSASMVAYAWHLSYDFEVGPFLRVYFLLKAKGLGAHQKFVARVGRAWGRVSQGGGVWRSDAAHPNALVAAAHGPIGKGVASRIKAVEKALWYEVQKEECLRIWLPERQRVFGMSEFKNEPLSGRLCRPGSGWPPREARPVFLMCGDVV